MSLARRQFPDGRRSALRTQVRPALATDIPALAALKSEVTSETFAGYGSDALAQWQARFSGEGYFRDRFESAERPSWFFFIGSPALPAGMAALKVRDGVAYLGDFYVRERGQGIGTAMLEELIDRAKGQGLTHARADVFGDNARAIRWLERYGFQIESGYEEESLGIQVHRLGRAL